MVRTAAAILLAALVAPPAWGADLTLFLGGEVQYDDNAFRRQLETDDNLFFRLRPGARIHRDRGDLTYSLRYEAPAEFTIEDSEELTNVDHVADGRFEYRLSDRLELSASDQFRYRRSSPVERFDTEETETGEEIPIVTQERDRFRTNRASLGLSYDFSPRWTGSVSARHHYFDSSFEDRSEVQTASGAVSTLYSLRRQHQIGAGFRFSHQEVGERETAPGSYSQTYNLFGQWIWAVDPTTELQLSAGPSLIQSEQDFAGSERATDWTVFGNAGLSKQWTPTLRSALHYERRQDETTGVDGTAVLDAVSLSTSWRFLERWTASLRGYWTRRETVADRRVFFRTPEGLLIPLELRDRFEVRRWGVTGRLDHRLFRNTHVHLRVTYDEQESRRRLTAATSDFDNFLATLGIRHEFERIKLW